MADSYVIKREQEIPDWVYNLLFCYATYKTETLETAAANYEFVETYVFYNARHRVTGELVVTRTDVNEEAYAASLVLNSWSWDSAPYTKENRLGLTRSDPFNFEDRLVGNITMSMAKGEKLINISPTTSPVYSLAGYKTMQAVEGKDTVYTYDSVGRVYESLTFERAGKAITVGSGSTATSYDLLPDAGDFLQALVNAAKSRLIVNDSDVFPQTYALRGNQIFNVRSLLTDAYELVVERYQELSAEMHRVSNHRYTQDGYYRGEAKAVLSPIAKLGRVTSLNSGRWLPVDLSESPVALAARYNGWIFNNGYLNLLNPGDVGLQQVIGAVDADYVYYWERQNTAAFDDIRAIRSALTGYFTLIGAMTCRALKIRHAYLGYATAIIALIETLRGADLNPTTVLSFYGVHNNYPFLNGINQQYPGFLSVIYDLIKVDLGANDSGATLRTFYERHFPDYNKAMHGRSLRVGRELSKLGGQVSAQANTYLNAYSAMLTRMLVADVDKALTEAFMQDRAMSGDIPLNDPAVTVNPGDTAELNFLDESLIRLKVTGLSISCDVETIDYRISVKRLPS